jgi:hypothetical protein
MFFVFASSVASGFNTSCGIWVGNPNGPVGGKIIGIGIAVQGLPSNYQYYVPSTFSSAELSTTQPRLVGVTTLTAARYDGASVFGNYNGTPIAPTGALTSGGANWSALPFQTGMRSANTGASADGFMCEVLCYNDSLPDLQVQEVEGYLAWKWGLQANLSATHPFKLAPPIMRAFQPMDVSGASLWLDAADPSTLSFSGPNVTQWRDKSGTGNHYATGGAITYSNQALVFPGNATMSNTNPINFSAGTTPSMTTFVVVSTPDGSAERGIFQYGQISCSKTGYAIYVFTPSEVHCTLYCGDLMVRNAITTNTRMMVADVVTYSGTPGSLSRAGWINGAAMTTTNVTTTGVNLNLASSSVIGNVAGGFWNGTMNEILYFNRALSTAERQEIEGYLAAKWNLPVRVPTTHPFRNVLPSTPLFAPSFVSGLALWLDAADTTTLTLSGSNVTAWADKSGNGRNAVGTTSNPTYNATGFNSRPTVTFSNNLLTSSNWSLAPNRQFAWFVVVHLTSLANIWQRILISASVGYPNGYLGTHSNTSNILGIAGSTTVTAPIATGTLSPQLVTYLFGTSELSSNTSAVSVNGGTFSTLGGNTGAIGTNGLIIGTDTGGGLGDRFLGNLSEVICYNSTVTQPQRQQTEGYLAWKWGLQARLPSTHPFARFRP